MNIEYSGQGTHRADRGRGGSKSQGERKAGREGWMEGRGDRGTHREGEEGIQKHRELEIDREMAQAEG